MVAAQSSWSTISLVILGRTVSSFSSLKLTRNGKKPVAPPAFASFLEYLPIPMYYLTVSEISMLVASGVIIKWTLW